MYGLKGTAVEGCGRGLVPWGVIALGHGWREIQLAKGERGAVAREGMLQGKAPTAAGWGKHQAKGLVDLSYAANSGGATRRWIKAWGMVMCARPIKRRLGSNGSVVVAGFARPIRG